MVSVSPDVTVSGAMCCTGGEWGTPASELHGEMEWAWGMLLPCSLGTSRGMWGQG